MAGRRPLHILGLSLHRALDALLAIVDVDVDFGTEVTLVWGEEGGGSAKPVVERHVQTGIRAIVSPCPCSEVARTTYDAGWRTTTAVA